MPDGAGGTSVSASRASSDPVAQALFAGTYFIFDSPNTGVGPVSQEANPIAPATAVAATGGPAGASGTGVGSSGAPVAARSGGIGLTVAAFAAGWLLYSLVKKMS